MIKIIHQTAKSEDSISNEFKGFVNSIKRNHPGWSYMFWSDQDNLDLIQSQYPDMLGVYEKMSPIQKSDIARYCVLHTYGGLYVDIDIWCNKCFEPLIQEDKVMLAPSPPLLFGKDSYTNYIMYSPRNHPFWVSVLTLIKKRANKRYMLGTNHKVSSTTGNLLLGSCVKKWKGDDITAFKYPDIYNLFCPHNLVELKSRKDVYGFHYGGTSRPQNNWSGGVGRAAVLGECRMKKAFGVRPNAYQLPILLFVFVILICMGIFISYRNKYY